MNEKKKGIIALVVSSLILVGFISIITISIIHDNKKIKEFEEMINSEETQILYFIKPTCGYCNLLEPITTMLAEKYDLKYEMIDASAVSNTQLTKMLDMLKIDESTFGTPHISIVKNGVVIGEHSGYTDEDVLFELFKKHGLIDSEETLKLNYIDKDILNNIWNNGEKRVLLVGTAADTSSIAARIELMELLKEYSISIDYFDTAKFSSTEEYNTWLERLNVEKLPVLAIVENGNIVSKTSGMNQEKYIDFFKQNGYIK